MSFNYPPADSCVRVPRAALPQVRLRHLASGLDLSIALPEELSSPAVQTLTGYTEWIGTWNDEELSFGWDWAALEQRVVLLNPAEVRTNVLLLDADGVPETPMLSRLHLAQWLDQLPWRESAIQDVVRGAR